MIIDNNCGPIIGTTATSLVNQAIFSAKRLFGALALSHCPPYGQSAPWEKGVLA
jgi:hypothetical protein